MMSPLVQALRPRALQAPTASAMPVDGNTSTNTSSTAIPSIGGETPNGDIRGTAKDLRSFDSLGDYLQDPGVRNDWSNIGSAVMGAISPTGSALHDMLGLGEQHGPSLPGGGLGQGGMADDLAAFGGGDVSSGPQVASGPEPSSPGMFAQGGVVRPQDMRGPNPPGPDQGYVGVHAGEVILNQPQQMALVAALRGRR